MSLTSTSATSTSSYGFTLATGGGNVGIGTSTPRGLAMLSVDTNGLGNSAYFGGQVGIGTTNPQQLLHVYGNLTGANSPRILLENGAAGDSRVELDLKTNGTTQGLLFIVGAADESFTGTAAGDMVVRSNQRLFLGSNVGANLLLAPGGGNVGIGTTTTDQLLSIYSGTTPSLEFSSASGPTNKWTMGIDTADQNKFKIASSTAVGTNARLTIDGSGNVGIGTTSPGSLLSVSNSSGTSTIQLGTAQQTTRGSCIQLYSPSGAEFRLYATTSGPAIFESGACQ